jgi:hypothetical protein
VPARTTRRSRIASHPVTSPSGFGSSAVASAGPGGRAAGGRAASRAAGNDPERLHGPGGASTSRKSGDARSLAGRGTTGSPRCGHTSSSVHRSATMPSGSPVLAAAGTLDQLPCPPLDALPGHLRSGASPAVSPRRKAPQHAHLGSDERFSGCRGVGRSGSGRGRRNHGPVTKSGVGGARLLLHLSAVHQLIGAAEQLVSQLLRCGGNQADRGLDVHKFTLH